MNFQNLPRRTKNILKGLGIYLAISFVFSLIVPPILFSSISSHQPNAFDSASSTISPEISKPKTNDTSESDTASTSQLVREVTESATPNSTQPLYDVLYIIDGDTIKANYEGRPTSVRLIGVNTPETVDPRKNVECFGHEASNFLKSLLTNKKVNLVVDSTQANRDKYNRLLRYIYLDNEDINQKIIASGYGHEFTYNVPYQKQSLYKQAQAEASNAGRGLWAANACAKPSSPQPATTSYSSTTTTPQCDIKGNINSKGEKIYHVPGQKYYNKTKIDETKGERWFCNEAEAVNAGWRRAKI